MNRSASPLSPDHGLRPFEDRHTTADGQPRASVPLTALTTLWFNTGTLCNIACRNCYIDSSPTNDSLVWLTLDDVRGYLDEIAADGWPVREIGFTGGEPFMNPDMPAMAELALKRGFRVLILTNAMRPMMRPRVMAALERLIAAWGDRLTFRVSIDHPEPALNDSVRGAGSHAGTLKGLLWLRDQGARLAIAGRDLWEEGAEAMRARFAAFIARHRLPIDAHDPAQLVLFPEMDASAPVPEITTACWGILGKDPSEVMCASSRMVVRRKGADGPVVLSCTLLPYDPQFEMGPRLADAGGEVHLNHPHCARFCVLGGASCSG